MFCRKCGTELDENASFCNNCGEPQKSTEHTQPQQPTINEQDTPKTGIGILFALLLGLIGLIIGLLLYKENTIARKTFLKAWTITYVVTILVVIIFYAVIFSSIMSSLPTYPTY